MFLCAIIVYFLIDSGRGPNPSWAKPSRTRAKVLCLKISELGAVAAVAGRLFQLAIVQGKKLNWMNFLVIRGS